MVRNQKAKETTKGSVIAKKAIEKAHQEMRGPSHHSQEKRANTSQKDLAYCFKNQLAIQGGIGQSEKGLGQENYKE